MVAGRRLLGAALVDHAEDFLFLLDRVEHLVGVNCLSAAYLVGRVGGVIIKQLMVAFAPLALAILFHDLLYDILTPLLQNKALDPLHRLGETSSSENKSNCNLRRRCSG